MPEDTPVIEQETPVRQDGGEHPTILLVEDEEVLLNLYQEFLREEGYTLLTARDGEEALEIASHNQLDLVLLDVRMPRLDGFTTCTKLRKQEGMRHVPILFLTALGDEDSLQRGISCGADDYMTKPVDPQQLRIRIRSLLKISRYHDELERALAYLRILSDE